MGLDKELEGVVPDSPTGGVDGSPEPESPEAPEAAPAAGEKSAGKEKKERTIDNVQKEFARKQEKQEAKMQDFMEKMIDKVADIATAPSAPAAPVGQKTVDQMSAQELSGLRQAIPEDNPAAMAELNARIASAEAAERVDKKLDSFKNEQAVLQLRDTAKREAMNRYPELANPKSDFYRKVDKQIKELGEGYVSSNPRAVLDISNDVAAREGVKMSSNRQPANTPANRSNAAPANQPAGADEDYPISDAEMDRLGKVFKRALPKGKEFNMDEIKETTKALYKQRSHFLRG